MDRKCFVSSLCEVRGRSSSPKNEMVNVLTGKQPFLAEIHERQHGQLKKRTAGQSSQADGGQFGS